MSSWKSGNPVKNIKSSVSRRMVTTCVGVNIFGSLLLIVALGAISLSDSDSHHLYSDELDSELDLVGPLLQVGGGLDLVSARMVFKLKAKERKSKSGTCKIYKLSWFKFNLKR